MSDWNEAIQAMNSDRQREEANYHETIADRNTPAGVIPRARRLMTHRHKSKPNWVLAMELYCVGSTYGWGICRDNGLDPEATR